MGKDNMTSEELVNQFLEYMREGYSGGKDGLRCSECDAKYSGTAQIGQLCPRCRAIQVLKADRQQLVERVEGMRKEVSKEDIEAEDYGTGKLYGYNRALDDVVKILEED